MALEVEKEKERERERERERELFERQQHCKCTQTISDDHEKLTHHRLITCFDYV